MNLLDVSYEKYKLDNGLEIILHHNKKLPLIALNIWYKTGSANEQRGKTGIAHLFEHMMFQGSQNVAKEMHFKFIQEAGGSLNGSTSYDRTNYYEKVPTNFLELILWLESDRMGFLLPAMTQEKLDNQREVVKNERLERYDNQPYGLAWEKIISALYNEQHPYSWPTIGYIKDMNDYSLEDVSGFFNKFYSPSNATLVLAGNFEEKNARDLIEKYFTGIKNSNGKITLEVPKDTLKENKTISYSDNVQLERIYFAWKSDKAYGDLDASFDVLSDILSGSKNSRLHKNLVYDKELSQDVTAFQYSGRIAGHFMIISTCRPGIESDKIKDEIFTELKNISENGITEKELIRSKNGIKSSFIYSMQNIDSLADHLNFYNYFLGEPNSFNFDLNRYSKIDNEEIKNAARILLNNHYVELKVMPKSKGF